MIALDGLLLKLDWTRRWGPRLWGESKPAAILVPAQTPLKRKPFVFSPSASYSVRWGFCELLCQGLESGTGDPQVHSILTAM